MFAAVPMTAVASRQARLAAHVIVVGLETIVDDRR